MVNPNSRNAPLNLGKATNDWDLLHSLYAPASSEMGGPPSSSFSFLGSSSALWASYLNQKRCQVNFNPMWFWLSKRPVNLSSSGRGLAWCYPCREKHHQSQHTRTDPWISSGNMIVAAASTKLVSKHSVPLFKYSEVLTWFGMHLPLADMAGRVQKKGSEPNPRCDIWGLPLWHLRKIVHTFKWFRMLQLLLVS